MAAQSTWEGIVRGMLVLAVLWWAWAGYAWLTSPEETLAHVDEPLDGPHAVALLGGIAVYLLAHVALRLHNAHTFNVQRLGLALVLWALVPVALRTSSLTTLAGVVALLWAMIAYETATYDERRYRLRHGLEADPPSR
jgi:hypothetical protein